MSRLVLISLGALSGALLESAARSGVFDEIVVATRNLEVARAKANNARIGAALEGCYPIIEAVPFDLHSPDAACTLADLGGDVLFSSPSMLPWWRLGQVDGRKREILAAAPFATFTACHLAPMLALRNALAASGTTGAWVSASSPDVVNHVLHCTGMAPLCGVGNVAEAVPKVRFVLAQELGLPPGVFDVRLVAQHAFEYYCYSAEPVEEHPPYLLSAEYDSRDLTAIAQEGLFEPYPIPYRLDFNRITVSASLPVLKALCSDATIRAHVPAPNGLVGGYPVSVMRAAVALDIDGYWTLAQAEAVNRASLPFDGIDDIDANGEIWFTPECMHSLEAILGRRIERLAIEDAEPLANELVGAVLG